MAQRLLIISVNFRHFQLGMLGQFTAPVDQHAGRTYHHKMVLIRRFQRRHGSHSLKGLAQAHLITQQRPLLMDGIFHTKGLVAAQGGIQVLQVQGLIFNGFQQFLRKSRLGRFLRIQMLAVFSQSCIVGGSILPKMGAAIHRICLGRSLIGTQQFRIAKISGQS